jgi:transcriptional regulator with XRE-family HTH domain
MSITKFGEYMRIFRVKNHLLMKDTADILGVKAPFLSAVENGKKKIPSDWFEKICSAYNLTIEEQEELGKAIEESADQVKINLTTCNDTQKNLVFQFQRSFSNLDEETSKKIIELLKGDE